VARHVRSSALMDAVFFGLKRAYHATLKFTAPSLAVFGLTPARFDLLFALAQAGGRATQSQLRRVLGVARSTISRMLTSLEVAGIITRRRAAADARQRDVQLTRTGIRRFNGAHEDLVWTGVMALAVDCTLATRKWVMPFRNDAHHFHFVLHNDPLAASHCFDQRDSLNGHLWRLRHDFGDTAAMTLYPDGMSAAFGIHERARDASQRARARARQRERERARAPDAPTGARG
jgi:DNA-binding MarR family transcriptional regulator